jgi:hypothetical protein
VPSHTPEHFFLVQSAQESDLVPLFGDLSQSSEIKLPFTSHKTSAPLFQLAVAICYCC